MHFLLLFRSQPFLFLLLSRLSVPHIVKLWKDHPWYVDKKSASNLQHFFIWLVSSELLPKKYFTTGLATLSHSRQSAGFRGLQHLETLMVVSYLLFILMPPVLIPFLSSPPPHSKEAILSSTIYQRSLCIGLQCKRNHDIQHFVVPVHPYAHTENVKGTLGHFRWPTIGPTRKRIFHLVYVQRLFCETWMNVISQLQWKAPGFVLSFCPAEDSASPVSYPVCAWKRLRWSAGRETFNQNLLLFKAAIKAFI